MKIKEYSKNPQLSLGFAKAGHEIVDDNEELSVYHEVVDFPDTPYLYIGYNAEGNKIFNAKNFGVPQNKILAWESNVFNLQEFEYPRPTVLDSLNAIGNTPMTFYQQFTVSEQGHDIIDLPKSVINRIKQVPAGDCWISLPKFDLKNKTYNSYRRLAPYDDAPLMTNVKKDVIIHPLEDRILTPREAGILQGFPADYELNEGKYQEIADAIPPIIGYIIGTELM